MPHDSPQLELSIWLSHRPRTMFSQQVPLTSLIPACLTGAQHIHALSYPQAPTTSQETLASCGFSSHLVVPRCGVYLPLCSGLG
jgi:hypothetical protein